MKKLLLLAMMCVLGLFSVNAQETIKVGTKNNVDSQFPIHTWWQYSYSQQIYTKAEINHGAANILKIAFFTDGETSFTRNVRVYMQNVTKGSFSTDKDWVDVTDADLVFDGTVTTSLVMEIILDKPFEYTGKNILLSVQDYTGRDDGRGVKFDAFDETSTRTMHIYDEDNSSLPGTDNPTGFDGQRCTNRKNVLQLTFDGPGEVVPDEPGDEPEEPGDGDEDENEDPETPVEPEQPGDEPEETTLAAPVVTAIAANDSTIVLTWEAVEGATEYNIYEGEELIGSVTTLFCEIRDLEANTNYCFIVTAVNGEVESDKSEEACATTLDVALPEEPEEPEEPGDEPEEPGDAIAENTTSFNIYPNPVNDKLNIVTEAEIEEIVVYDVYGRIQNFRNSETQELRNSIDVTDLNSGIYFVKVVTDNGEVVKRFVKK